LDGKPPCKWAVAPGAATGEKSCIPTTAADPDGQWFSGPSACGD